jgi:hypothetical protein
MSTPRIFISHSSADKQWARQLAEALTAEGASVWFDEMSILPGEPVVQALEAGLRESDAIAILLSPASIVRPNTFFELGVAIGAQKMLIPIVDPDLPWDSLPHALRLRQYVPKTTPQEVAHRLIEGLRLTSGSGERQKF